MLKLKYFFLTVILQTAFGHHDIEDPWHVHFHEHGLFRAFFGGFFSTLLLIFAVLGFYYYCVRDGTFGRSFPLFPKKPIMPITIPFARAPNYIDPDRPETIVLTTASRSPSVFYANKPHTTVTGPWTAPHSVTVKPGGVYSSSYNAL